MEPPLFLTETTDGRLGKNSFAVVRICPPGMMADGKPIRSEFMAGLPQTDCEGVLEHKETLRQIRSV